MQKNQRNVSDFFPGWNFNSASFYLFLPSLKEEEKSKLTTKIIKHKGKITFTISKETIIVIENSQFFKNKNNKELIKDFDTIYYYENNFIKKINIRNNKTKALHSFSKSIRIITINALNEEINIFDSRTFDYFIQKGLDATFSQKNVLCLYPKNKYKKINELIFYNFNSSKNIEENDIPFYHPKAPENFSLFCSEYEYRQVLKHLKTEEYKNQLLEKKMKLEEEQKLKSEPEPAKKEFLCQICKSRFDNYLDHIKSSLHAKNKSRYNDTYMSIKNTFKRITEFNTNKTKNVFIPFENNILVSTKEDSIPINEENNKNIKDDKKNLEKIVEENESQRNEEKNKSIEDNNISVKDILKILNTIEIKGNVITNKKRKKNDMNIFKKDNNYIVDFKKITKKIWYYNNILDELK